MCKRVNKQASEGIAERSDSDVRTKHSLALLLFTLASSENGAAGFQIPFGVLPSFSVSRSVRETKRNEKASVLRVRFSMERASRLLIACARSRSRSSLAFASNSKQNSKNVYVCFHFAYARAR